MGGWQRGQESLFPPWRDPHRGHGKGLGPCVCPRGQQSYHQQAQVSKEHLKFLVPSSHSAIFHQQMAPFGYIQTAN